MPDTVADLLPAERQPVHVMMRRRQPRQVKTQTARPPAADLHRGEMTPSLMFEQGHCSLVGFVTVNLDRDVLVGHPTRPFLPG
jgi:hypothetical protein